MGADAVHTMYLGMLPGRSSDCDADHHFRSLQKLGQFKSQYPEAKVIGVEAVVEKKKAEGLVLDGGKYSACFVLSLSSDLICLMNNSIRERCTRHQIWI
jgi:hypothetical protein